LDSGVFVKSASVVRALPRRETMRNPAATNAPAHAPIVSQGRRADSRARAPVESLLLIGFLPVLVFTARLAPPASRQ
jgi:hypothetical protein